MEDYRSKIMSHEEAKKEIDRLKAEGKRVVFTNGCFDILHPGHTRYLYTARALGDYLVVAVNNDQSVRAIKGEGRPILPQDARTELLAALSCVDCIVIFSEENPLKVIQYLMPHILVKGGDWKEEEIIGADVVKKAGGQVELIPYIPGFSTTDILEKIRS
jgi:D-beta-D-heptose 7-phosphate kinase/D-beta-D-heptose 1-phosphate adenosyltransferase